MKKIILFILILLLVIAGAAAGLFLGSATRFHGAKKALYIRTTAANKASVLASLQTDSIIGSTAAFGWLAARMGYWDAIKPGKYAIKKGSSLLSIIRMLRNGQQTPVNFTITKVRTKETLARMVGSRFECDSAQMDAFLNSEDSLKSFDVEPEVSMSLILPDTYSYFWNTTPSAIYKKMAAASSAFWTAERKQQAATHGLTPLQAYILASIIDEESNAMSEKGTIASVYLNRIAKGMPLQADPTIKFALKDFSIKRIYEKYLSVASPYNTYRNKGLPPGPICTPSRETIDQVITAPATDYIYFVADSSLNGRHVFTTNYADHIKKAHQYQHVLNRLDSIKKAATQTIP